MNKKVIIISLISTILVIGIFLLIQNTTKDTYAVSVGNTLVEYVIAESKGSGYDANAEDGVYLTNDNEYRYVGAEPNNYVWFNNDMYRIIGVFDENTHGVFDENGNGIELVKLIRNRILDANAWGIYNTSATSATYKSLSNDWTGNTTKVKSSLNVLLNHFFLEDTTNSYGTCENWTYISGGKRTYDCSDIIGYGIKKNSRMQDYIETVTWHLKGYTGEGFSKQNFYLCERGLSEDTTNCGNAGTNGEYSATTFAKIGLMYVSDYLYASGNFSSSDTEVASSNYYGIKNWLYKGHEWSITPVAYSTNNVFRIYLSNISKLNCSYGLGVRPSFYLKASVYVTGGNGSFDNPYTIACDDCSA